MLLQKYDYHSYINSDAWRLKKEQFKQSKQYRNGRCFICTNKGIERHIHHRTYKRLGEERMNDLMIVCAVCHAAVHANGGSKRMRARWYPYASRNKLWRLRREPKLYAQAVARFFGVLQHPFVTRILA